MDAMRKSSIAGSIANERGAVLAIVAVALAVLLAAMSLAIDLSMLLTARAEAQRAADAAALAGAQEFMTRRLVEVTPFARASAYQYARANAIRNVAIDSSEVTVEVFTERRVVRVTIRRPAVATWFARIFGVNFVPISAVAAAEAAPAGSVKCLKPFAVPDLWDDVNGNSVFEPNIDRYQPHGDTWGPCGGGDDGTGYGSCLRGMDRDYGRQIKIKVTNPNDPDQIASSYFFPIRLINDDGKATGADVYRDNIRTCNKHQYKVGDTLHVESGDMVGPTYQGVNEGQQSLVGQDQNAYWDETTQSVKNSVAGDNWMDSPRVAKIALFAPTDISGPSDKFFVIRNFALVFIEEQRDRKDPVTARFLYFAQGDETTEQVTGSLVKVLRLIE
jgi:hypothetical protein